MPDLNPKQARFVEEYLKDSELDAGVHPRRLQLSGAANKANACTLLIAS